MSQLVDSFSPARPINTPTRQPSLPRTKMIRPNNVGPINLPRNATPVVVKPALRKQETRANAGPRSIRATSATKSKKVTTKAYQLIRIPIFIVVALSVSFLLQSIILGGVAIALYATYAFVKRISSKVSFQLSIVAIIGIVALVALGNDAQLVSNFTIYTLLLIIIGTISLAWDTN